MTECSLTSSATSISFSKNAGSPSQVLGAERDRAPGGSNKKRHVTPVRTRGERPPLFCVFPGPPGSSEFVEFLPDDQPSYDFYFTKLDGSENFPTVEQLAQIFLSEIREIQPQGPYQLCGYSKAGLVAYEIARLLLNAGESVPFLALFETWHPGFEKNLTAIELAQFRVLHIADRMQKYSRDLLQGRVYAAADLAWKGISRRVRKIGWRVARRFLRGSSQPVPRAMQQVEAIVVLKSFVPKPFPTRFILVRSDGSFETKLRDRTLGWRQCAAEGVEVFFVAGDQDQDHGTMMNKPYVRNVIEKIRPFLVERSLES